MNSEIINSDENELETVETQTTSLVSTITKAEIDTQIATAHAYPRKLTRVRNNVTELATFSQSAAEECGYALKRSGKAILGPSIRLAEIVASQFGNCRVGARVVHVDKFEKYVEAEGVFHDLETNTATTARVRRRISGRDGRVYNDDMIVTTGNAACSIAKRNAILAGVPKALWMPAYEEAMRAAKGDIKTLSEQRTAVMKTFANFGVTEDQLFAALDIEGIDDMGLDEVLVLRKIYASVRAKEATLEDFFPSKSKAEDAAAAAKGTAAKLGQIADQSEGKAKTTKAAPEEKKPEDSDEKQADGDSAESSDEPTEDEVKAQQRGYRAGVQGRDRKCPPDIAKDERLSGVWFAAFDQGKSEAAADDAGATEGAE